MDDRVKQSYLRYHRKRAKLLAVGIALVISSLGVANLFMLLPVIPTQDASVLAEVLDKIIRIESHEFVDFSFSDKHVLAPFSFIVMIAIGSVVLGNVRSEFEDFSDVYRFVSFTYTAEEKEDSKRSSRKPLWVGIALCVVATVLIIAAFLNRSNHLLFGIGELAAAAGVGFIVFAVNDRKGIDLVAYNYKALRRRSIYSLEMDEDLPDTETMIAIKYIQLKAKSINQVIVVIGAVATLALYFLPTLYTPFFWIPIAAAFVLCAIITRYHIRKARPFVVRLIHR